MDWADERALDVIDELLHVPVDSLAARKIIAAALRESAVEARQAENEKCRKLIEKRVGETKYQGA